jgi:hypothetical protein
MTVGLSRDATGDQERNERKEGILPWMCPSSSIGQRFETESVPATHSSHVLPQALRVRLREILVRSRDPRKILDQARCRATQIFGGEEREEGNHTVVNNAPRPDQEVSLGRKQGDIYCIPINGAKSTQAQIMPEKGGDQGIPTGGKSTPDSRCQQKEESAGNKYQRYECVLMLPLTEETFLWFQDQGGGAIKQKDAPSSKHNHYYRSTTPNTMDPKNTIAKEGSKGAAAGQGVASNATGKKAIGGTSGSSAPALHPARPNELVPARRRCGKELMEEMGTAEERRQSSST